MKKFVNNVEVKKNIVDEVKLAVQINGKTRDIITAKNNSSEKMIEQLILSK